MPSTVQRLPRPDYRLIAHPKDRISSLQEVQSLPFFSSLPFGSLREIPAPFVPVLDGETDVGYFDSFTSPEDMAKYAEVFKKQRDVEAVEERGQGNRNNWVGFTFGRNANLVRAPLSLAESKLRTGAACASSKAGRRCPASHVLGLDSCYHLFRLSFLCYVCWTLCYMI